MVVTHMVVGVSNSFSPFENTLAQLEFSVSVKFTLRFSIKVTIITIILLPPGWAANKGLGVR